MTTPQATCEFECYIHAALSAMKDEDKCLPWYYPQVDAGARLCSPFEARSMREKIDTMSSNMCKVFLLSKPKICYLDIGSAIRGKMGSVTTAATPSQTMDMQNGLLKPVQPILPFSPFPVQSLYCHPVL